jgi:hypothetical protein
VKPQRFPLSIILTVIIATCTAAIAGAWFASLHTWKQSRQEFLAELVQDCKSRGANVASYKTSPDVQAPSLLWLVDETGIDTIYVLGEKVDTLDSTGRDRDRAQKAKALFPEATIVIWHRYQSLDDHPFQGKIFDE